MSEPQLVPWHGRSWPRAPPATFARRIIPEATPPRPPGERIALQATLSSWFREISMLSKTWFSGLSAATFVGPNIETNSTPKIRVLSPSPRWERGDHKAQDAPRLQGVPLMG